MVHGPHGQHGRSAEGAAGLLYEEEAYRIRGAVYEVNREMGAGFLEAVYQECLAIEMASRDIPFTAAPTLRLAYKGRPLRQGYVPDFVCFDAIVVELKATRELDGSHRAQVLNYLKATNLRLGLLVNFGCAPRARIERIIL